MASAVARDELISTIAEATPAAAGKRGLDAESARCFVERYFASAWPEDLEARPSHDLLAVALSHRLLGERRAPATPNVRVYQPDPSADGWRSELDVIDIVTDDMPFLLDSVVMELNRHGLSVHVVLHPVIRVRRDGTGRLGEVVSAGDADGAVDESFLHLEFGRLANLDVDELAADVARVLGDVRKAVGDWSLMRAQATALASDLGRERLPVDRDAREEAVALLHWMVGERFTFLGYREYELEGTGPDRGATGDVLLRIVPGSGLGILRDDPAEPVTHLTGVLGERAREPTLLNLTKTNSRATIHRASRLDYVGIKRFDDHGNVIGERRFLGLYTSAAYNASAFDVPVVRRKVVSVVARAGFPRGGHSTRRLVDILETYPRDELFQIDVDLLYENAMGILRLHERQRVRLFRRVDPFERYVSCLVYVPRDRYTTAVRVRIGDILSRAHAGSGVEYTAHITESPLARLHFVVRTTPGELPPFDLPAIERELVAAARSWVDDLHDELLEGHGDEIGGHLFAVWGGAFPPAYRDDFGVATAVADLERLVALAPDADLTMSLYRPDGAPPEVLRLKMFRSGERIALSDVLPVLEHFGVVVVDERPYSITATDGSPRWVFDFGLVLSESAAASVDRHRQLFLEAFAAIWRGEADNDGFNRLVLEAGLSWRQVVVLRAYRRYLRQTGSTFSQSYMERTVASRPELIRLLMALFDARFNPDRPLASEADRLADIDALALQLEVHLELIQSLDEDRIFRGLFRLLQATTRTNFYQREPAGRPKTYLSLKLDPTSLPDLPEPRPKHEVFVHSPRVEGLHLRGGAVARGGLRWSDRPEDFRTEILGLMKAQLVKNSVIVPVGAKGGFVVRHPTPGGDRETLQREAIACYRELIMGLLDITDNLVDGRPVPPERVVRHDGDDTYLVVAADKGTATFSDIANEIAVARGFWLGDAFASGGSSGYDHKKMGITARGAWESVKRHFRELGIDLQHDEVRAVGIGDMSGDVFGNGMLLSRHLRLVAAFDHRHVFLDPSPDPAESFAERQRLFELPRSSWDDYDRARLSPGGGVFPRTAKSIPLSPEVRQVLDLDVDELAPPDLIQAILRAPVDLLWNGGVGTYVKASTEANSEVGDKANDAVRVDGADLRCRVVGEGGNLGCTQRGRVEYALAGGRIFTDAIDNSAGVDCSDHEVNIKILLDAVVRQDGLTPEQRDTVLASMTDDVAHQVVHDNYAQTQALSIARAQAFSLADVHSRIIGALEQDGRLDRALEFLPTTAELVERRSSGQGLTTPELAILLAYTKVTLDRDIRHSDLPDDPYLSATLTDYFPPALRGPYATEIDRHPLRREIIATCVSNLVVNRGGTSLLHRLSDETQASSAEIVRGHLTSAAVFAMDDLWRTVEQLDDHVDVATQTKVLLGSRRLVERATRWFLQHRSPGFDIGSTVECFAPGVRQLSRLLPQVLIGDDHDRRVAMVAELVDHEVPVELAEESASLDALLPSLDLVEVSQATGQDLGSVAAVYFAVGYELRLDWLRDRIEALPRDDRWRALARASLRAELFDRQRAITAQIVTDWLPPPAGRPAALLADPQTPIERWLASRQPVVDRYRHLWRDMSAADNLDLPVLSVALRVVQDLAGG